MSAGSGASNVIGTPVAGWVMVSFQACRAWRGRLTDPAARGARGGGRSTAARGRAISHRMRTVKRIGRRLPSALIAVSVFCGLTGCKTAAPPPPPVPVVPAAEAKPTPPQEYVRVTGTRLNVREQPATSAAAVARVKKGERLAVLGRDGGWVRVQLPDGTSGWVHGRYVRSDAPCTADKPTAELLSDVPLSLTEGASAGKVVLDATVDATGSVASIKIVQDTTGIPELVQRAESEVRALRFSPPVRNCRPVPFVYTYTRNF